MSSNNQIGIILTVDGRAVPAELGRAGHELDRFGARAQKASEQAERGIAGLGSSMGDLASSAGKLYLVVKGIEGISSALASLPRTAFDYTKQLETSALGMAGIMGSVASLNGAQLQYNQALGISQDMIRKLGDDALRTAASSQELVGAFQALLAPGLAAGMKLDEIRQLTVVGTNAVKSMGLQGSQVVQELRDLVAGGITASSSTLATALGLKDSDIAAAKASSEGLFKFLMDRLKGFEAASEAFGKTLDGRLSALKEGTTRVAADGMQPLTDAISTTVGQMADLLITFNKAGQAQINPEIVNSLRGVSESMASIMQVGQGAASAIWENRDAVTMLAAGWAALKVGSIAADLAAATQATIARAQASRLAAAEAAVEVLATQGGTAATREKTAALLAELQARAQSTASVLREAVAHEAVTAAKISEARATVASTAAGAAQDALISGRLVPALLASEAAVAAKAQAERSATLASNQLAAATRAASASGSAMGSVMGALGGPIGIAISAVTLLIFKLVSLQSESRNAAKVAQSLAQVNDSTRGGERADDRHVTKLQAKLAELKDQRDELLIDQKDGGLLAYLFPTDYAVGATAQLRDVDQQISTLEESIGRAKTIAEVLDVTTGNLSLTLAGSKQAWMKAIDGVKTAASIQSDYQDKLSASRRAYEQYAQQLKASGANEKDIGAAKLRQVQAERALVKQRDDALKGLNGTRAAGIKLVDTELAGLKSKLEAERQYGEQLATTGLKAQEWNEGQKQAAKLSYEVAQGDAAAARSHDVKAKAQWAVTRAELEGRRVAAEALGQQQAGNQVREEALKALDRQATKASDAAVALEAENQAWGKSKTAIEAAALAVLQLKKAGLTGNETQAYREELDRAIAAQQRWVDALGQADYKKQEQAIAEWNRAATEQAELYRDELQLSSMTALEQAKITAQRSVRLKLAKAEADIERQTYSDDKEQDRIKKDKLIADARTAAGIESSAAVAKVVQEDWRKTSDKISDSLTDALMRGFESGKGFAKNLRDTVVNMFQTMVLRPVIQAIVQPVAGAVLGSLGMSGSAQAGQAGGSALGQASSLYDAYRFLSTGIRDSIGNGFTKLASTEYGQKLGLYDADAGVRGLTESGQLASSTLQSAGSAMTAYSISKALSGEYKIGNGKIMDALTAVGGWFDSIGGLLSGAISAGLNRAFGMGAKEITGNGISGKFSASGASVRQYADWHQDGGWFRSDKSGTKHSAISSELDDLLDTGLQAVTAATKGYASALGLSANAVNNFSQSIKVSLRGLDEAGQQKAITDALAGFGAAMSAQAYGAALAPFQRAGETTDATLTRLGGSLTLVNGTLKTMGQTLYGVSVSAGDMASQLLDKFGGAEKFSTATASYYQDYYTEAERTGAATQQVSSALKSLGYTMPTTREGFRDLVESQNLTTESGRATYAALMGLESAFAALVPSTDDLAAMAQQAGDAISSLFGSLTDSIAQGRAAVAEARVSIGINQKAPTYADLVKQAGGIGTAPPSTAALDKARTGLVSANSTVGDKQKLLNTANAGLTSAQKALGTATSAKEKAQGKLDTEAVDLVATYLRFGNVQSGLRGEVVPASLQSLAVWSDSPASMKGELTKKPIEDVRTFAQSLASADTSGMRSLGSTGKFLGERSQYSAAVDTLSASLPKLNGAVSSAKTAVSSAQKTVNSATAALQTAKTGVTTAQAALTSAETAYTAALTAWVDTAGTSVQTLDKLRESTVDYYEQQKELAALMLTSAANVRAAVKQARLDTMTGAESLATRLSDYDKTYTLALSASASGSVKAGYADQLAATLPQLAQDLAATATSRADWAVAVAKLSAKGEKVAGQLDATAPKDYQAEANALLGLIDGKLVSLNTAANQSKAALETAVNNGATRTATGLQQIINQLQGKKVTKFATGGTFTNGVVDTPTTAPMALFGEAGPEAIMPLSRGPGGVLGVRMHGGAGPSGNAGGASERLLRDLVDEVRRLRADLQATQSEINSMRRENNIGNAEIATQTKKTTRMIEKWDVVGLPATATV